ncbi:MAG TPA: hypothetical protein VN495_00360, partial [Candidatus Paceibacterota bacterium]|nr:hypothetical protein [Candidatus Paceibacterota bacterium]
WNQIPAMAPAITQKDETGGIQKSLIAFGTYQNIDNAKDTLAALFLQMGLPLVTRSSAGILSGALSNGTAQAAQPGVSALSFYTQFSDPSQSAYSWNGALQHARAAFAAGDVALYVGFASEAPAIMNMNPNLNFAIAPLPQFAGTAAAADFGRTYAFAIPRVATNQQGALTAIQFLDAATTTGAFARAFGMASARRDELSLPASGYASLFNKMAILSRSWDDPDPAQTNPLFQAMIENTLSGANSVSQALQNGAAQLMQIITAINQAQNPTP